MTTSITISNLVVQTDIGIYPHEIGTPQAVRIDTTLQINRPAPLADEIASTLDYDDIQQQIISIAQARHYNLLETLCASLANGLMKNEIVMHIDVSAQKLYLKSNCEAIVVRYTLKR